MEWRGGMMPHFGLSNKKVKDAESRDYFQPTLRRIENDWNQFRGPERNGHIPTTNLPVDWKSSPKTRWSTSCGSRHSSIVTHGDLLITSWGPGISDRQKSRRWDRGMESNRAYQMAWYVKWNGSTLHPHHSWWKNLFPIFKRPTCLCRSVQREC